MSDLVNINDLSHREKQYYNVLYKFYLNYSKNKEQMQTICDIINSKHPISLRLLDWFVVRYCNLNKTDITVKNEYNNEDNYGVYNGYIGHLNTHDKYFFDPFKRIKKCKKFLFKVNEFEIVTNICQLVYFKWLIQYDILKYVQQHPEIFESSTMKLIDATYEKKRNIIKQNKLRNSSSSSRETKDTSQQNNTLISFSLDL
jgi:hypothetical protein